MKLSLAGKTALVTGASSGIGRAVARALGRAGVRLALSGRRVDALAAVADDMEKAGGQRPLILPADLSKRGEARDLAARALSSLRQLDILVNNAGVGIAGAQHIVGDDDLARELFETNYWSPLALVAALVPAMRERRAGTVVNVASIGAVTPMPLAGHYASSKAALSLHSETLRMELSKSGVRVLSVLPGAIDTGMLAEYAAVPGGPRLIAKMPVGSPEVLARKIVRALERGQRTLVYPSSLALARHLPTLALRASSSMMADTVDIDDPRKLRGGSQGDVLALEARSAFDARP